MVDIEKAKKIRGWMFDNELQWLAEQAAKCSYLIIEIGSYQGRSTVALAANTVACVWAVDRWDGPATPQSATNVGGSDYEKFLANTAGLTVVPIRKTSLDAAKEVPWKADMIFIDGSHDYESVRADILAWKPALVPNGLLCGHDYGAWPGVKQAVDECFPAITLVGSIWSVRV